MTAAEIDEGAQAWMGYWAGFGSVNSVTKTTHIISTARGWKADGAEITNLYAALATAMTAAEIDEGAWEAAWQAFRSMCRHGYIPDKTDLGVALRAYIAALPAPASGAAEMRAEAERLRSLLEYRDEFIVSRGLWQTFVDGLPRALPLTEPGSNP
jgi:hypothetical protein